MSSYLLHIASDRILYGIRSLQHFIRYNQRYPTGR